MSICIKLQNIIYYYIILCKIQHWILLNFHLNSKLNYSRKSFTNDQQQLFIASFYCYLNHNSKTDFIISLDSVWKWCGFSRIDPAKFCD